MTYLIDLKKHNVNIGDRLIIYSSKDRAIYKKITVRTENTMSIKYFDIIKNIHNYKFKFQLYENNKWVDKSSYFFLISKESVNSFTQFLLDKNDINELQIRNTLMYFSKTKVNNSYIQLIKLFRSVTESLWLNHNTKHNNLLKLLNYLESSDLNLTTLWENIKIYWQHLLFLKHEYQIKNYNNLYWDELHKKIDEDYEIQSFIKSEIENLKSSSLQFAHILIAQYYSILGNRKDAENHFKLAVNYDTNWEFDFLIGQGSSTYKEEISDVYAYNPTISSVNEYNPQDVTLSMVVSMDEQFLRNYGPQLLFNIIALKKYHLHIHLVSRDTTSSIKAILETENLFESLIKYSDKRSRVTPPTFSYEIISDDVTNMQTYSACARYIHAEYFLNTFDNDILILDADMFLTDDLKNYLLLVTKHDIGIAFSKGLTSILPWRRVMAGNVYLKNNSHSKSFASLTKDYILANICGDNTWTLDQNALNYAYERIQSSNDSINFLNIYKVNKPFSHPAIRKYIEQK